MRKPKLALLTAVAAALSIHSAASLADRPVPFPYPSSVFIDVDPCTGELQEITINFDVSLHLHKDNYVAKIKRTGTTDAGYEMIAGNGLQRLHSVSGLFFDRFVDVWRAADGRMFQVTGQILIDINASPPDNVKMVNGKLRCIGGETILP